MFKVVMYDEESGRTCTAQGEAMDFNYEEGKATFYYYNMLFTIPICQLKYIAEMEEDDDEEEGE